MLQLHASVPHTRCGQTLALFGCCLKFPFSASRGHEGNLKELTGNT